METLAADWEQQLWLEKRKKLDKLPEEMQRIATQSATLTFFSPNEEKLLYTATQSATIPQEIIPLTLASNTQVENRQLKPGNIYVYDIEEDKNFLIVSNVYNESQLQDMIAKFYLEQPENIENTPIPQTNQIQARPNNKPILTRLQNITYQYSPVYLENVPQWFPTSNHIVYSNNNKITISEYDGTNNTNIYSGPFEGTFAYPWPNGNKMVILTSFTYDNSQPTNLYGFNLQ